MRNWVSSPSVYEFVSGLYKGIAIRSSDLIARFYRTKTESWSILIFENGIVTEVTA